MAVTVLDCGALRLESKYILRKVNTYYFRRRIPQDVRHHYPGKKSDLFFSLKTKSLEEAARLANKYAKEQDALWAAWREGGEFSSKENLVAAQKLLDDHSLRFGQIHEFRRTDIQPDDFFDTLRHLSQSGTGEIIKENLPEYAVLAADMLHGQRPAPHLSEVAERYVALKSSRNSGKSKSDRDRVLSDFYQIVGDLPLDQYSRSHANALVCLYAEKGNKTATIKRKLNQISPVIEFGLKEYEIEKQNVFSGIHIPDFGEDVQSRSPYSVDELHSLESYCRKQDDDIRWLAAMLQDTGARLSEVLGLASEDIFFEGDIPHIHIRPNSLRRLKNNGSERTVPLVGASLWAAKRVASRAKGRWAFPRYIKDDKLQSTHASNALNKSLKTIVPDKTAHSFRHAFRDRLRNVGCPSDVIDQLGGWATGGVGTTYGDGYSLRYLHSWLQQIPLDPKQI